MSPKETRKLVRDVCAGREVLTDAQAANPRLMLAVFIHQLDAGGAEADAFWDGFNSRQSKQEILQGD